MNSLLDAVVCGDHAKVKALLGRGADPNHKNSREMTALHLAAIKGHRDIAETLLDNGGDGDLMDVYGRTPLQCAASSLHRDAYNTLLPKTHQPDWNRLLHALAQTWWKDEVEAALAHGANPNSQDDNGYTPVERATFAGRHSIVVTLLDNRADPGS